MRERAAAFACTLLTKLPPVWAVTSPTMIAA